LQKLQTIRKNKKSKRPSERKLLLKKRKDKSKLPKKSKNL